MSSHEARQQRAECETARGKERQMRRARRRARVIKEAAQRGGTTRPGMRANKDTRCVPSHVAIYINFESSAV